MCGKVVETNFFWGRFRGCRFDRAFVVPFDDVFTYKSYVTLEEGKGKSKG